MFDFKGKGFIEVEDITESNFVFRLPLSKEELGTYLRNDTVFKKMGRLKQQMFTKYFFPHQAKEQAP